VGPAAAGGPSKVELVARAAPLGEVLDRLARQVGMKVVYESGSPRQLVTLSLQGRTPAETVLALLEGQGLNFALQADPTGAGVQTLLVTGSAPSTGFSGAASGRPAPSASLRRPNAPPPGSGPDAMDMEEEEPEEDEPFDQPVVEPQLVTPEGAVVQPGQAGPQPDPTAPVPNGAPVPVPGAQPPNVPPQAPRTSPFPVSPFAPQPAPYLPQPYAPLNPVVPGAVPAPGAPGAPQQQQPQEPPTQPPPG
jgi:hypothetical protein